MDIERKIQVERRKRDIGPPKGMADRRLPAAKETELSAEEFARYFGAGKGDAATSVAQPSFRDSGQSVRR